MITVPAANRGKSIATGNSLSGLDQTLSVWNFQLLGANVTDGFLTVSGSPTGSKNRN